MWIDDVLRFWFDELETEQWWLADSQLDARIRERFAVLHADLVRASIEIPQTPHAHLAAVIVLDQFSRNMFRSTPAAFAADAQALSIAQQAIELGYDRQLTMRERQFLYMPFMHSEDVAVQRRSVELFTELGDAECLEYAIAHHDIIERFNRFPHRNAVLQRESTEDEQEFINTHAGSSADGHIAK